MDRTALPATGSGERGRGTGGPSQPPLRGRRGTGAGPAANARRDPCNLHPTPPVPLGVL